MERKYETKNKDLIFLIKYMKRKMSVEKMIENLRNEVGLIYSQRK